MAKSKRPRDTNQLAKFIVDLATGGREEDDPDKSKNPAAVAKGRKGGLKGGKSRMASLTNEQRRELGRQAANSRWKKEAPANAGASGKRSVKEH
ncbi:MAG: histone H1 [Steroidobacteraceae bacterium]